jgi:hypothetical protein
MEHLSLEIFDLPTAENPNPTGSKYANLQEDASITITDTSEIFASGDVWSYSFTLNIEANVHIFGSAGEMHGARLHEQINNRRARLWVTGEALYLGYLKLGDEADVDSKGNVDVTFESGQKTFEQLIEGAKANQVPLMNDVTYGVALWRKRWTKVGIKLQAQANFDDEDLSGSGEVTLPGQQEWLEKDVDGEIDATQEYPRMVFPKGEFLNMETDTVEEMDFLNTDYPYDDEHPYCNVALCYQKSGYEKKNENDELIPDYSSDPEPQRGYEIMPANRVNSAPNFYVIYWLRCLMKHLNIHIDENQMMDVTDLRRLFFVNTRCEYKKRKYIRNGGDVKGMYRFSSAGRLVPEQFCPTEGKNANLRYLGPKKMVNIEESKLKAKKMTIGEPTWSSAFHPFEVPKIKTVWLKVREAESWTQANKDEYEWRNSYLHEAIATPECFPDVEISEVISALESGFGLRLLFSENYKRVRIVLLRNVFRSEGCQDITCEIIENTKTENCIRGFRMTYGDSKDTAYYYKGFNDLLPHKAKLWPEKQDDHDYSKWDLNAEYEKVMHKVSAFNVTCYVTPVNGNAYGIKVDKDAKRYEDLHPSLFEYAGFMDAEDGDCTGEDNTIEEISVGFKPAIMNDTNWEEEHSGGSDKQIFALFVGEEMQPRRPNIREDSGDCNDSDYLYDVDGKLYAKDEDGKYVYKDMMADDGIVKPGEFAIASDLYMTAEGLTARIVAQVWGYAGNTQTGESVKAAITWPITDIDIEGHINEGYRLYLQDNFTPNDEGVAPVENHDWGLTLGIMRGSGEDMGVQYEYDPDDHEGNDTWEIQPGSSITAHPDMCDNYGKEWDYNGQQEDIGMKEGRISLKLRAEKPNPKFGKEIPETVTTKAEAAQAMTALYTTANCSLLSRPRVTRDTLRASGWECPGSGYETTFGRIYSITFGDNEERDILFSPITPGGQVMTPSQMERYMTRFTGRPLGQIMAQDVEHLVLDVNTSKDRAEMLEKLQAYYYAEVGETLPPIDMEPLRYLEITTPRLRRRGLCDQFYKEYSYWVRHARIAKIETRMELSQLIAIDKTKKVRVGDIYGFIRKMQYTVSQKSGLGNVTMEIMYI